jgi:hypothetical protein
LCAVVWVLSSEGFCRKLDSNEHICSISHSASQWADCTTSLRCNYFPAHVTRLAFALA